MISAPHSPARFEGGKTSRFDGYFLAASVVLLCLAAAAKLLRPHLRFHNPRVLYGVAHLPFAFCFSAVICAAGSLYLPLLRRRADRVTTRFALLSLWGASLLLWLPIVHASRLTADDWFLAAAAAVRHSLAARPWLAWYALDTVDGNFRPLGTVVYFNHGSPILGFYAGFMCCVLAATLLYFIARRLGAASNLALCAALIFISRDLLYGPVAWLCSLGDDLAIASGAACVLLLLGSLRSTPGRAALCHLGAFACFAVALLSKQSAYCIPLLALLTLTLRPGQEKPASTPRQWAVAVLTTSLYLAAAMGIFRHARHLSATATTPYPVAVATDGIGYLLRCVVWFFGPLDLQIIRGFLTLEILSGAVILALLSWFAWMRRGRLGLGNRAFVFSVGAAFVSIALFLFLPSRRVPYYADFAALWASLPVAAILTRFERSPKAARRFSLVIALVVLGGISMQLKRTALIPSGSYLGGTYGMDTEAAEFAAVQQALLHHPDTATVVVRDDSPDSDYPSMIRMISPDVRTIYVVRPKANQWLVNSLNGSVAQDNRDAWTDVGAFHWVRPLASEPILARTALTLSSPQTAMAAAKGTK